MDTALNSAITLEQIVQAGDIGIIATDGSGRIVFINRKAQQVLDFEREKVLGRFVSDVLPLTGPQMMQCLKTKEPLQGYHVIGKKVSLVINITIIETKGRVEGAVCCLQRMEEFEAAAKKLESYRMHHIQLKAIFQSLQEGIWILDPEGRIIDINPASEKMNAIRAADRIGTRSEDLIRDGFFDRSASLEAIATKKQVRIYQYVKPTKKHLFVTSTPILDKDGNISLVIVNERDVTQINQLKEQLEENKMVAETYKEELAERNLLEMKKEQNIISKNEHFNQIIRTILKLARMDASNILLLGESGTGKGLLSKFIHKNSPRSSKPLIQINCAAIPESLLEAELFGYEKGAFTGASQKGKIGLIEVAHEGILFLDEIAELPFGVQAKILKYLDDHEVMRLGSTKAHVVDCCIIAATNRDLERLVKEKKFREDLYYRLSTFMISIPPLRERKEDLTELIRHLLETYNKSYQQNKHFSPEALSLLYNYPFPGNVRELKNVIERAVVMSDEDTITEAYLKGLETHNTYVSHGLSEEQWKLNDEVRSVEQEIFVRAMACCKSTREMAGYMGISQSTVVRKMKSMGLSWSRRTEIAS